MADAVRFAEHAKNDDEMNKIAELSPSQVSADKVREETIDNFRAGRGDRDCTY